MSDATDVLRAIDELRRDLNGYHGQLKAHDDLQLHCDNQQERIAELEGLYARVKAERDETAMAFSKEHDRAEFLLLERNKLRELVRDMHGRLCNARLCGKCPDSEACGFDALGGRCTMLDDLEDRMRDLGIEVDE